MVVASSEKSAYRLFVGSAEWTEDIWDDENAGIYVKIKVDGKREVHRTMTRKTPCWDEGVRITGDPSSVICVEIQNDSAQASTAISCIGHVEVPLEALLDMCADGDFAALELTLMGAESGMGLITLELRRLPDNPIELGSLQNDEHATMNVESYKFYVGSVKWTDGLWSDESMGFYVNIKLDDRSHKTKVSESIGGPCWDEELQISGGPLSIIYFEIMRESAEASNQDSCIGRAEVLMEALLIMCADNEFAALKITMTVTDSQAPGMGFLTVKLTKLVDPIDLLHPMALEKINWSDKTVRIFHLGIAQLTRFERLGELSDLESAIANLREAVELTDDAHPSKPGRLSNLGNSRLTRFERLGELADLESAIVNHRAAANLTDDAHPDKPMYLSNLGNSQFARFERLGELSDLEGAIVNHREAANLIDDAHPKKPGFLSSLGVSQRARFKRLDQLTDLESSITNLQEAVEFTDDAHPAKPVCLANLGISQRIRFERLDQLADLESSVANLQKAVELADDRHPKKPGLLINLGVSQRVRFERLDQLSDLESAIANQREAVDLIDDGNPKKPSFLFSLGISQRIRFTRLNQLADLEDFIANQRQAVELTDDGHTKKLGLLSSLGGSQRTRFDRLDKLSDLHSAKRLPALQWIPPDTSSLPPFSTIPSLGAPLLPSQEAASESEDAVIPELSPEPRSYWIDLHLSDDPNDSIPEVAPEPLEYPSATLPFAPGALISPSQEVVSESEDAGIPELSPEPRSYWIDLHLSDDLNDSVPELAPELLSYSVGDMGSPIPDVPSGGAEITEDLQSQPNP